MKDTMFEMICLDDHICAFTHGRLNRNEISKSLYCYDVRDTDLCEGLFAEIRSKVYVNHLGTILCKKPFPLDSSGSYFPKEEADYLSISDMTIDEFQKLSLEDLTNELSNDFEKTNEIREQETG